MAIEIEDERDGLLYRLEDIRMPRWISFGELTDEQEPASQGFEDRLIEQVDAARTMRALVAMTEGMPRKMRAVFRSLLLGWDGEAVSRRFRIRRQTTANYWREGRLWLRSRIDGSNGDLPACLSRYRRRGRA